MVWEALQNLGIVATGTAAAGLIARYGIDRFSGLVERGIERSAEVGERGIERFSEVVEEGIEQFVDREIARHEAELGSPRVASSRLHDERASVVLELYQRLVAFERAMRALPAGGAGDAATDELLQEARESGNDFADYYAENKIYFPPTTCDAVERIRDEMNHVFLDVRAGSSHGRGPEPRTDVERSVANWHDVSQDEVPELKAELEDHFRELLGVDVD